MKPKILFVLSGLIACSLWIGGCNNDGPALEGVQLNMKAVTSLFTIPSGRIQESDLVFEQVFIGVTKVEFETSEEDDHENMDGNSSGDDGDDDGNDDGDDDGNHDADDDNKAEFKGPFVVDLIAGTSTPEFGFGDVSPGHYDEIEIKLGPVLDNQNSVFIVFTYKPDGVNTTTVEFSTQKKIELEIDEPGGYELDANTLTNILVLVDLDALFVDIDLSAADADQDGVIRINDTSNSKITEKILSMFDKSCHAGEDNDHNDEFDED
ncbi:MAG: hypothetical protein OEV24_12360 [Cyclobacteriaceae bacterium]|nr:hypothetical protein [Cyclobacteriaceae bacterium]